MPGARKAPDGHFYVPDPKRKGKFMRVMDGPPRDDGFHPALIGARKAPDGNWYVPHHGQSGKYLRVVHNSGK